MLPGGVLSAYLSRSRQAVAGAGGQRAAAIDSELTTPVTHGPGPPGDVDLKHMLSKLVVGAKTAVFGSHYWIPSDNEAIVSIPSHLVDEHSVVLPNLAETNRTGDAGGCPELMLLRGAYGQGADATVVFHLCIVADSHGTNKIYSFHRSANDSEVRQCYNQLIAYVDVFAALEHKEDVKEHLSELVSEINSHWYPWPPAHVAAKLNLTRYFDMRHHSAPDLLRKELSQCTQQECTYALLLAVREGHTELVERMLSVYGAQVNVFDGRGNNAMHAAAACQGKMVQTLAKFDGSKALLNATNNDNETPIFLAIKGVNPSVVGALLEAGAKLVNGGGKAPLRQAVLSDDGNCAKVIEKVLSADPAAAQHTDEGTGNSLLHIAAGKIAMSALLSSVNCHMDIDVANGGGWTALHTKVHEGDVACVVTLAAYGCRIDKADGDGNTALHMAVAKGDVSMVRALIVLGADVNVCNARGHTALHSIAGLDKPEIVAALRMAGAHRCPVEKSAECADECTAIGHAAETRQCCEADFSIERFRAERRAQCVEQLSARIGAAVARDGGHNYAAAVSLDGGGIRGLVLVMVLQAVERHLPHGDTLVEYLDWMAGTSTGSFVCAALASGKTLRECQRLYLRFKDKIFQGWARPYDTKTLERFIEQEMGANTTLADIDRPRMIITTVAAASAPCHLHLFRNYKLPALTGEQCAVFGADDPKSIRVAHALRCSSAAPTYFTSVDGVYVDGGLIANNPTLDLLAEVELCNALAQSTHQSGAAPPPAQDVERAARLGLVLSVGCGRVPDQPVESLDMTGTWPQFANFIKNLGLIMIEQATQAEGAPVDRSAAWCSSHAVPFYRFTPPMSKPIELNTTDDSELVLLLWETFVYLHSVEAEVKQCAEVLRMLGKSNSKNINFG